MTRYKNLGGFSGVTAYDLEPESIKVQFHDGSVYLYTYRSAGRRNIEQMKKLATRGRGLNSFINTDVRKKYSRKLK